MRNEQPKRRKAPTRWQPAGPRDTLPDRNRQALLDAVARRRSL